MAVRKARSVPTEEHKAHRRETWVLVTACLGSSLPLLEHKSDFSFKIHYCGCFSDTAVQPHRSVGSPLAVRPDITLLCVSAPPSCSSSSVTNGPHLSRHDRPSKTYNDTGWLFLLSLSCWVEELEPQMTREQEKTWGRHAAKVERAVLLLSSG